MITEQPATEEELQVIEAYRFAMHYKDSVFYLNTIEGYTAESLISASRAKLSRKLARLRKLFKDNDEALDVLSDLGTEG